MIASLTMEHPNLCAENADQMQTGPGPASQMPAGFNHTESKGSLVLTPGSIPDASFVITQLTYFNPPLIAMTSVELELTSITPLPLMQPPRL
jgi:hypothetical protein